MDDRIAIRTVGLQKSYGRIRALRSLDLEVKTGEIFGFLGPNGAGKTTTIRCLLDLIRPNGGEIRVLGVDPKKDPVAIRARSGYLPGELHFDENMTVDGALRFLDRLRRGRTNWEYVRRICDSIDLDRRLAIRNLSKGNKQKVGLVQALMHKPELLLLDEPTFGLDPLVQREVLRLVRKARTDGATVFFSSHILSEVQEIADRVGIIRKGVLAEIADKATLMGRSVYRAHISFKEPVDAADVAGLPGVKILGQEGGQNLTVQVEGEMDRLIKTLAGHPVRFFETERPSLEEIFLSYYADDRTPDG